MDPDPPSARNTSSRSAAPRNQDRLPTLIPAPQRIVQSLLPAHARSALLKNLRTMGAFSLCRASARQENAPIYNRAVFNFDDVSASAGTCEHESALWSTPADTSAVARRSTDARMRRRADRHTRTRTDARTWRRACAQTLRGAHAHADAQVRMQAHMRACAHLRLRAACANACALTPVRVLPCARRACTARLAQPHVALRLAAHCIASRARRSAAQRSAAQRSASQPS